MAPTEFHVCQIETGRLSHEDWQFCSPHFPSHALDEQFNSQEEPTCRYGGRNTEATIFLPRSSVVFAEFKK
jgi:hypothetical protein